MKEKKFNSFVAVVRLVGSLWLGFLVSFVPLYIFRGNYHDAGTKTTYENLIITVISVIVAALCLFLMYRSDDEAAKMEKRDTLKLAVIPSVIHILLCTLISWTKYPAYLLGGALSLASLLAPEAHGTEVYPAWSWILAVLIITPILAVSVFVGCLAAKRKREKELAGLHKADLHKADLHKK